MATEIKKYWLKIRGGGLTDLKHFITIFVCIAAILVVVLFFSSGLTGHAAFSGHSPGLIREELYNATVANHTLIKDSDY